MSGRFDFQFGFTPSPHGRPEEGPFRLLVLADLSGDARASEAPGLAARRPVAIDVDTLEQAMARLAPSVELELPEIAEPVSISFGEIEDLHPDRLFARLPVFAAMRDLRARLADPNTFAAAAAELERLGAAPRAVPDETETVPAEDAAATMARLLGGAAKPFAAKPVGETPVALSRLFEEAVAPHVVPASEADQRLYLAALDERIARLMRGLLHHPAFQRLEAAWRGLAWLVASLPTGEDLAVHVLDMGRADLLADLRASGKDITRTALHKLLVEETVGTEGGERWSLIAADLTIEPDGEDIALAAALATLGAATGAPVIAVASPRLLGCESLAATPDPRDWRPLPPDAERRWQELRAFEHARWLGLALPRVLLRRPYGALSECDRGVRLRGTSRSEPPRAVPVGQSGAGGGDPLRPGGARRRHGAGGRGNPRRPAGAHPDRRRRRAAPATLRRGAADRPRRRRDYGAGADAAAEQCPASVGAAAEIAGDC